MGRFGDWDMAYNGTGGVSLGMGYLERIGIGGFLGGNGGLCIWLFLTTFTTIYPLPDFGVSAWFWERGFI